MGEGRGSESVGGSRAGPRQLVTQLTRMATSRRAVKAVSWSALSRTGASLRPVELRISSTKWLFLTLNWSKRMWAASQFAALPTGGPSRRRSRRRQPAGGLIGLTMIKRTITKPMLAAMSMAPKTERIRMLRKEMSF